MLRNFFSYLLLFSFSSCIDRVDFTSADYNINSLIVDGYISDEPGPYEVRIFRSSNLEDKLNFAPPIIAKQVTIYDDMGNTEVLRSDAAGTYTTSSNGIQGVVGRKYSIRIELNDGSLFESLPDELSPGGSIDSLYSEFESKKSISGRTEYGLRMFVNTESLPASKYFRWKYSGTYKVETNPELHVVGCDSRGECPEPRACSGFVYDPIRDFLRQVGPCDCCTCWVFDVENKPIVKNNELVQNGKFKAVEVGYVPINEWTFFDKYLVEVQLMSLSKRSFEYWKIIQDQKENTGSLFQPALGTPKTNIITVAGRGTAQGFFYATSITREQVFLTGQDIPISVPKPELTVRESCLITFDFSTNVKPENWN